MRKPTVPRTRVVPAVARPTFAPPIDVADRLLPRAPSSTSTARTPSVIRHAMRPLHAIASFFGVTTLPDKPHTLVQKVVHVMEWSAIAVCVLLAMLEPIVGLWPFLLAVQVTALFVIVMRMPPDRPQPSLDTEDPSIALDKPLIERRERRRATIEANREVVIEQG